jgi:hypothetical protein
VLVTPGETLCLDSCHKAVSLIADAWMVTGAMLLAEEFQCKGLCSIKRRVTIGNPNIAVQSSRLLPKCLTAGPGKRLLQWCKICLQRLDCFPRYGLQGRAVDIIARAWSMTVMYQEKHKHLVNLCKLCRKLLSDCTTHSVHIASFGQDIVLVISSELSESYLIACLPVHTIPGSC